MTGQIAMYNIGRGFGFIAVGPKQIFFHAKNFERGYQPVIGRFVNFDLGPGLPGKPQQAVNVRYTDSEVIEQRFEDIISRVSLGGENGGEGGV